MTHKKMIAGAESSQSLAAFLIVIAGLLCYVQTSHAQDALPLSGPPLVLADEAYKAYAAGNYLLAAERAREALRQRPDVAALKILLQRAEAAQRRPTQARASRPASRGPAATERAFNPPAVQRLPELPAAQPSANPAVALAFASADAAYKAYGRASYAEATVAAAEALRLAPENPDYRLLLVQALIADGRLADAEQALSQAVALHAADERFAAQRAPLQERKAQLLAAAAYKALEVDDPVTAAARAREALQVMPGRRDYQVLLVDALYRSGQYAQADEAASIALANDAGNAALAMQRGFIRQRLGQSTAALQDFESALGSGRLTAAAEVGLLVELGRKPDARRRFDAAMAAGDLADMADVELAYLAARVGDDDRALAAFGRADASGKLAGAAYQDAAYTAMRLKDDTQAETYFRRTVDEVNALRLRMEPQLLFNTRRAIADVSRQGGLIASLSYRQAVSGQGAVPTPGADSLQAGVEGYWRPWGYQNGQYAEVFARAFQTLYANGGGATGLDTLQAAVGIRYKLLSSQNLVGSFSRVFSPSGGRSDWLAQIGYSIDIGTDLRVDTPSWWTVRASAELGRYLSARQSYGLAHLQWGKSLRLGDAAGRWVLFPHLSVAADYDSAALQQTSLGLGPGLTARYWFREDNYAAPRSYVDLSFHYRTRLSGAERARGAFVTTTVSY